VPHSNSIFTSVDQALTKIGMDGSWQGANRGSSYLFFAAAPGEHPFMHELAIAAEHAVPRLCQGKFTAEEGKVYYFRERVFPGHSGDYAFDLDPANSDEGKYLVAVSAASVSHPKK
jgi:hypothetical protein